MATVDPVNLASLLEDAKCFALVRQHRWPEGVRCPGCGSDAVVRNGHDDTPPHRQRYRCQACASRFDDLSGTGLAGHHQPLRIWVLCLYFMGLNLSNRQIAAELGLSTAEVQLMTEQLHNGTLLQGYANLLKRLDTSESVNFHKCLIPLDSCRIHATRWGLPGRDRFRRNSPLASTS